MEFTIEKCKHCESSKQSKLFLDPNYMNNFVSRDSTTRRSQQEQILSENENIDFEFNYCEEEHVSNLFMMFKNY